MTKFVVAQDCYRKVIPTKADGSPDFKKLREDRAAGIEWPQYDKTKIETSYYYEDTDSVIGLNCVFWSLKIEEAKRFSKARAERIVRHYGGEKYASRRYYIMEVEA